MKVVFVGDLRNEGNSGAQRHWAMQQCGLDLYSLDKQYYLPRFGRWSGHFARLIGEPGLLVDSRTLGRHLIEICFQVKPDIVWLEWAREISSEVILELKKLTPRPLLISFQDDNPWGDRRSDDWMWKNYFRIVPLVDLHLVKRRSDIEHLKSLGAKNCRRWRHGVFSPLFHPSSVSAKKEYPVSFIGTCMDNRKEFIKYLLEQNVPVHVFGNRWTTHSDLPRRFPSNFYPAVEGKAYADTIRKSQLCLGLVSHSNHDEWTMRTYEVPGCAVALVAERTRTHEELFVEDAEAVFFSGEQECVQKIRELLHRPLACDQIGKAGYEKICNMNWTIESSMDELFTYLKNSKISTVSRH